MTIADLLVACRNAGVVLRTCDGFIDVNAPVGAITDDLRATLLAQKPMLLEVLWRLEGMRTHREPVPTAKSATDAPGGPGRCFSCGARHDHPEAYGRCAWCWIAAEAFYTLQGLADSAAVNAQQAEAVCKTA